MIREKSLSGHQGCADAEDTHPGWGGTGNFWNILAFFGLCWLGIFWKTAGSAPLPSGPADWGNSGDPGTPASGRRVKVAAQAEAGGTGSTAGCGGEGKVEALPGSLSQGTKA